MSTTPDELFSDALQETHLWLKDVQEELAWEDESKADLALEATSHVLRDHLSVDEAAYLGARLPMLVTCLLEVFTTKAGPLPTNPEKDEPRKERRKAAFPTQVREYFRMGDLDVEPIVHGVFTVLAKHVTDGEIDAVKRMLPPEIRELGP